MIELYFTAVAGVGFALGWWAHAFLRAVDEDKLQKISLIIEAIGLVKDSKKLKKAFDDAAKDGKITFTELCRMTEALK